MKDLLTTIVKELVDRPDKVIVSRIISQMTDMYEITVDKEDRGKVIGKQGVNIKSLRILANACSMKNKRKAILEIVE